MPVTRLFARVAFFALSVGLALGQSSENNSLSHALPPNEALMRTSISVADSKDNLASRISPGPSKTQPNDGLVEARDPSGNSADVSQGMALGPESERTCYFIRDYVVIRDHPHSDSTHRDGSFTCVPGSRFRVYTTGR
jgi:hypothetical protein